MLHANSKQVLRVHTGKITKLTVVPQSDSQKGNMDLVTAATDSNKLQMLLRQRQISETKDKQYLWKKKTFAFI